MAGQVELLVMRGSPERAESGGDGVVRARLDFDVVRGIGIDQVNGLAAEEPIDVCVFGGVAAQKAVVDLPRRDRSSLTAASMAACSRSPSRFPSIIAASSRSNSRCSSAVNGAGIMLGSSVCWVSLPR
jgi:hypothetical protein